eukprot:CAMPEP_0204357170 /NCGR_PEP_ID=MMETSP0469-20131031/35530_1 /ASSEMBLY_ACC=CAM_ASM_000384 /TAXON_ID=2969 /ORGANISM="Oxyrrhis marina" /LENGTH=49 /DNA_ID= /DNA_START= /DNA_END= /DNA_ORIENTATION=
MQVTQNPDDYICSALPSLARSPNLAPGERGQHWLGQERPTGRPQGGQAS